MSLTTIAGKVNAASQHFTQSMSWKGRLKGSVTLDAVRNGAVWRRTYGTARLAYTHSHRACLQFALAYLPGCAPGVAATI